MKDVNLSNIQTEMVQNCIHKYTYSEHYRKWSPVNNIHTLPPIEKQNQLHETFITAACSNKEKATHQQNINNTKTTVMAQQYIT